MGSWAVIKSSFGIIPAFAKMMLKRPSILFKENLPYFFHRLKNKNLPLTGVRHNLGPTTYVGVTDKEIAALTEEDVQRATYTKMYLKPTRGFQVNSPPIVALAKKLGAFDENVSRREYCERVFNFVRDDIKFEVGDNLCGPYQDALMLLRSGVGVCLEQSALAVTLARAGGIPSRCKIDFIKLPPMTQDVVLEKYGDKLDSNPFLGEMFNIFGVLGGPHMGAEFYIDDEWICGETALDDYIQAALGNPLSELGEDMVSIGIDSQKPITLMRYGKAKLSVRFMMFMIRIPMLFLLKTINQAQKLLDMLREDGRQILEEAGGRAKYKEMMQKRLGIIKTDLPERPSLEEIEEFKKNRDGIVGSIEV